MRKRRPRALSEGPTQAEQIQRPKPTRSELLYEADGALTEEGDDDFGRWAFSVTVADLLARRSEKKSMVVGINAPWGDGKTTVLNYIDRYLEETHPEVLRIRYTPWLFQGSDQVILSFFETLAETVSAGDLGRNRLKVAASLRRVGTSIGSSLSFGAFGINFSPGDLIQGLSEKTIEETKEGVSDLLDNANRRVIVLIDDIDRMDNEEVATLFKLVKVAADFDYINYVLAFDDDAVSLALSTKYGGTEEAGRRFVEKIVQLPLALPAASREVVREKTISGIARGLLDAGLSPLPDENLRLINALDQWIVPRISNPRLLKRLLNAVVFAASAVGREVNYVDLVLVESIRTLYGPLYGFIRSHKELLTGVDLPWVITEKEDRAKLRAMGDGELNPYMGQLPVAHRVDALALLTEVFPFARSVWGDHAWEPQVDWAIRHRACDSSYFDRYFAYGTPVGDVSTAALEGFVNALSDRELDAHAFRALTSDGKQGVVIQRLLDDSRSMAPEKAESLIQVIGDVSEDFGYEPLTFQQLGSSRNRAVNLVARLFIGIPTVQRDACAEDFVSTSASLVFVSDVLTGIRALVGDDFSESTSATPTFSEHLDSLFGLRLTTDHGASPFFVTYGSGAPILYNYWLKLTSREVVDEAIRNATAEYEEAFGFLASFDLSRFVEADVSFEITPYEAIAKLTDPQALLNVLKSHSEDAVCATADESSSLDEDGQLIWRFGQMCQPLVVVDNPERTQDGVDAPPSVYWWRWKGGKWWPPASHPKYFSDPNLEQTGTAEHFPDSSYTLGTSHNHSARNSIGDDKFCNECEHGRSEWHVWRGPHANRCVHPDCIDSSLVHKAALGFRVSSARYGSDPTFADVTDLVQELVQDSRLDLLVNNQSMGGDPIENVPKVLSIYYRLDGVLETATVDEGDTITLP
jgi:hypothetical protein